jgi:hypothetical protein
MLLSVLAAKPGETGLNVNETIILKRISKQKLCKLKLLKLGTRKEFLANVGNGK